MQVETKETEVCRVIWDAAKAAGVEIAGLSWGGCNVHGTHASIDYVRKAVHYYEQMDQARAHWQAIVDALKAERDAATARAEGAEGERDQWRDRPETDATDYAHPAWWRGNDAGVAAVVAMLSKHLDGEPVVGTVNYAPLQAVRARVAALLTQRDAAIAERDRMRAFCEKVATPCSEPLNSAWLYRDKESRRHFQAELRREARAALTSAKEAGE